MEFFRKQDDNLITCTACARHCEISQQQVGYCGVRENGADQLKLMVKNKVVFLKKKEKEILVGSVGSNMRITFDANWDTSLFPFLISKEIGREGVNEKIKKLGYNFTPEQLVDYAKRKGCEKIVFQFNEPLVYIEYVLAVARLFDVSIVTTGYFSKQSLVQCLKCIKEIQFVFFSTFDKFYIKHCDVQLEIIKKNIQVVSNSKVSLKILYPLIPGESDVLSFCNFLKHISLDIQVCFVKFIPSFRMLDKGVTTEQELKDAVKLCKDFGLKNVDFVF